jgi:Fe-S-cluster containining protein
MLSPCTSQVTRDPGPFSPDLKCCTYFPFLPNFSIGAIFQGGSGAQKLRLAGAMAEGFVSPLGLFPSAARRRREQDLAAEGFGRTKELLCPFFDPASRGCGIWEYRPGVCQSYFCVSEQGAAGLQAWRRNEERLNGFEWSLAHEVLWECGYTMPEVQRMEASRQLGSLCHEDLWFGEAARKEDFFLKAYRVALSIKP